MKSKQPAPQLDPRTFRQEFEASFENLTGLVAVSFNDANISTEAQDISVLPLLLGVDFNVDPMSGICCQKRRHPLRLRRNHDARRRNHLGFAEEVTRRYGVDRRVVACPDPTGGACKTSGVGVTDHTISPQRLYRSIPKAPWKIRDKITAVNTALLTASGARRTYIHPPAAKSNQVVTPHPDLRPWHGPT